MTETLRPRCLLPALLLGVGLLGGCLPAPNNQLDEYKEYHYLAGKNHVTSTDFRAAIESFQKALEANPQSGAAHFELAWIYDQKEPDPAAAIYHYNRFLQLRPTAVNADMVRTRVLACKQELARTVSFGPVTRELEQELKTMATENAQLRLELTNCRTMYAALSGGQTSSTGQALRVASPTSGGTGPVVMVMTRNTTNLNTTTSAGQTSTPRVETSPGMNRSRTHEVRSGDTLASIARRYNVKLSALQTANPKLNPNRMQVGQSVVIPGGP